MARFKILPTVDTNEYRSAICTSAVTDADIGKPMKLTASDTYDICSVDDNIDGFLAAIDSQTQGGHAFVSIMVKGLQSVQLAGGTAVGLFVQAAAPSTLNTAETGHLAKVKTHTAAAADAIKWRVVSGTGLDGDLTAVIESLN